MLRTFQKLGALCACSELSSYFFMQPWNGIALSDKIFYLRGERTARSRPESRTKRLFCVGLMMGRAYFTLLVSFVVLSHLVRVKGAIRCTEAKPQLREIPDGVSKLSECMLECTGMTYFKKLRLQDKRTIKFEICTEGEVSFCRRQVCSSVSHFLNVKFWLKVLEANHNRVTDVHHFIEHCCCLWALIKYSLSRRPWWILLV